VAAANGSASGVRSKALLVLPDVLAVHVKVGAGGACQGGGCCPPAAVVCHCCWLPLPQVQSLLPAATGTPAAAGMPGLHRCACLCTQRFGPDGRKDSKRFSFSEVLDVTSIVVDQVKEGCGRWGGWGRCGVCWCGGGACLLYMPTHQCCMRVAAVDTVTGC
jgi:hypothetical protein